MKKKIKSASFSDWNSKKNHQFLIWNRNNLIEKCSNKNEMKLKEKGKEYNIIWHSDSLREMVLVENIKMPSSNKIDGQDRAAQRSSE